MDMNNTSSAEFEWKDLHCCQYAFGEVEQPGQKEEDGKQHDGRTHYRRHLRAGPDVAVNT